MRGAPTWLQKIKFITFYAFNGCDVPWTLYIEMSQKPVHKLVMNLLAVDLSDIVQTFFTPKGLRSKRHGRKGRRGGRPGGGIPDVNDMIAEKLPGSEDMAGRKYGMGQRFFFEAANTADRVQWNLALIEMITDTIYETIWGILKLKGENCPNIGRMLRKTAGDILGGGNNWEAVNCEQLKYIHNMSSTTGFSVLLPAGQYAVVFAYEAQANFMGISTETKARLFNPNTGEVYDETSWQAVPYGGSTDVVCAANVKGPALVHWQATARIDWTDMADVVVNVIQIGN